MFYELGEYLLPSRMYAICSEGDESLRRVPVLVIERSSVSPLFQRAYYQLRQPVWARVLNDVRVGGVGGALPCGVARG